MKIYLVWEWNGYDYDDYSEDIISAFVNENQAKALVTQNPDYLRVEELEVQE